MYTSRYERIAQALRMILEIGKRDMSNPKYDGYFQEAKETLALPPVPSDRHIDDTPDGKTLPCGVLLSDLPAGRS